MSRDSSVGIATDYGLGGWDSIPGRNKKFSLSRSVHTGSVAHLASSPIGTDGSFAGNEAVGAADHPPPSSVEAKNGGAIPPLPHISSWRSAS
jgi:hypothetical protein